MQKEEKIADGIYITKFQKQTASNSPNNANTNNNHSKYVYKSTAELISILESDFEEKANEIKLLYSANEEMLLFDPHDYDLIQAREDNLVVINKRLLELKEIQNQLKSFCPTNPIVIKNIFDYIQKEENKKSETTGNNEIVNEIYL